MTIAPSKMDRRLLLTALFSLATIGAGTASAATITTAGADLSSQTVYYYDNNGANPGTGIPASTWGSSTTGGVKDDFRSTDTAPKAYVLAGNPNVYGNDGYAFFGVSTRSGTTLGTLQSDPTYVSDISLAPGTLSQGVSVGTFGYIDNPTLAPAAYNPANTVYYGVVRTESDGLSDSVLTFTLASAKTFRVGIMTGDGDGHKPATLTLSSGAASDTITASGTGGYVTPDWYFFDVTGAAGDVFTLSLTDSTTTSSFSGIVFDSVAVPEPSTWAMFGLGFAALIFVARARRNGMVD